MHRNQKRRNPRRIMPGGELGQWVGLKKPTNRGNPLRAERRTKTLPQREREFPKTPGYSRGRGTQKPKPAPTEKMGDTPLGKTGETP